MSNHSPFGDALDTNPTNAHRVTAFDTTRTGPPRKPQPHPSRAPSLLRRWRASGQMILLIVIVAQILDQGLSTVIVPIAPSIAAEYNMSSIATGLLFAAKPMGNIVVQPFVGPICDRLGRNVPMAFGFVLLISSSLLFGLASSLPLYYIARVVQGFGTAFSATAGMALLADCYMDDQQRGEAISLAMAGSGIGVLAGPPFGGVTFQYGGLKLPFLIIAGICLVDGLLLVLFLGSPQERAQKAREFERARQLKERATKNRSLPAIDQEVDGPDYDDDDDDDETNENETSASQQQQSSDSDAYMHAPSAVVEGAPKPTGITTLLRDPNVLACVCVIGAADSMPSVLEPLLPGYLTSVFAASPLETGLIFGTATLGYALTNPIVGKVGTRFGRWRCAVFGCVVLCTMMCLLPLPPNQYALIPLLVVFGAGIACVDSSVFPILGVLVDNTYKGAYGSVYALGNLGMAMGFTAGPLISTAVQQAIGFAWALRISGIAVLAAAPLLFSVRQASQLVDQADLVDDDDDDADRSSLLDPRGALRTPLLSTANSAHSVASGGRNRNFEQASMKSGIV